MKRRLAVPSVGLTAVVTPVFPDQELDTARSGQVIYREGDARVEAAVANRPVRGRGYVEMTGLNGLDPKPKPVHLPGAHP